MYGAVSSLMWLLAFWAAVQDVRAAYIAPMAAFAVAAIGMLVRSPRLMNARTRPWLRAALFGLGHCPALAVGHWYVWKTAAPALPLLLLYLAAFPALAFYLTARLRVKWPRLPVVLTLPLVWVALEIVRGEWLIGGYPWYLIGHALTREGGPAWTTPYIGAYGCSLLLLVIACVTNELVRSERRAKFAGVAAVLVSVVSGVLFGPASAPVPVRTLRVTVVQTNLPQDNKIGWSIADRIPTHLRWLALSEKAAAQPKRPQLIVWPETMFPGFALNPEALEVQFRSGLTYSPVDGKGQPTPATWFADALLESQVRCNIPFLVGAIGADGLAYSSENGSVKTTTTARTNSAMLVTDGRVLQERYDKVDLMAFGEYIPVVYRWPAVQQWVTGIGAHGMAFDLAFGARRTLFNVEGVRVGTPICFEICHEGSCRDFTTAADGSRRADLLINLTNDGWFYESDFNRRMHMLQARWRCAELATPMVRAANTGISCVIDSSGKVLTTTLDDGSPVTQTEGTLTADVPLSLSNAPSTFYARAGHHLNTLIAVAGGVLSVMAFWPVRRTKPSPVA
jgi:apolipoprotein N-acyltransferase